MFSIFTGYIAIRLIRQQLGEGQSQVSWLNPYLGEFYLDEINRDVVDQIRDAKREEAEPSTVNRYLAVIRAVLNAARDDWEWIDRAPKVKELFEWWPGAAGFGQNLTGSRCCADTGIFCPRNTFSDP